MIQQTTLILWMIMMLRMLIMMIMVIVIRSHHRAVSLVFAIEMMSQQSMGLATICIMMMSRGAAGAGDVHKHGAIVQTFASDKADVCNVTGSRGITTAVALDLRINNTAIIIMFIITLSSLSRSSS